MKTTPVTPADLAASVMAVPPLARTADGRVSREENGKLIRWLASGGVETSLIGGNANLYNMGVREYGAFLDDMEAVAGPRSWIIPSVGADYGKAADQIEILRGRAFPTAMVLPLAFPASPAGVAQGLRRLADRYGRPLIAYMKNAGYLDPADAARLLADGVLCAIKYAVVRSDPADDPLLAALVDATAAPERIVSGIGERPVIAHLTKFGLKGFTSGSVTIAPHLSTAILQALARGDRATAERLRSLFLPLEDLRDAHSPIVVLHDAVRLAGIADTGPLTPFLTNLADPAVRDRVAAAATTLKRHSIAHAAEPGRAPAVAP